MVFNRQKARAGANLEYPPRTQPETNICEVHTPSQTVLMQKKNELFDQRVVKYSKEKEFDDLYYNVLGLNESLKEDDMKKAYHKLDL